MSWPLQGVLPKDYGIFEPKVLEDLMRVFDSEQIKHATGDVFGRIYEYFLAEFSVQKAHDNGEFFTPSSLVQTIVNVIEPDNGVVFDPACGSGGMFVPHPRPLRRRSSTGRGRVFRLRTDPADIHTELADLNREAAELAAKIQENLEGLGI